MKIFKFSIKIIIIAVLLLLLSELPIFATTGKSTVSSLRIRKTPSTDGEVIDVLAVNDPVEILGEDGDWYKVSAKGNNGYVSKQFVSINGNIENNNISENVEQTIETNNQQSNQEKNEQNSNEITELNVPEENIANNDNNSDNQNVIQTVNQKYKISESTQVNILPVLTSEIIGELKKGEEVNFINSAGLWVYVQSQNIHGWVKIDKLSNDGIDESNISNIVENNNDESNNQNNNNQGSNENSNYISKIMYAKVTAINVRKQSNTESDIVCSIGINEEVKVIGEEGNWYKIEWNGKSGYIRNDLLSNTKTEISSRSNNIDRNTVQVEEKKEVEQNNVNVSTVNSEQQNTVQSTVPVSSSGVTGNDIVAYAQKFVGCKYVYGAAGPNSFDCSGLTMYVYKHFGYSLSHSSRVQATQGKAVTGELQPGDILVFTNNGSTVGHVGIYIGNDKFIHASDSTTGVIISNLSDRWNKSKYMGARRIL